MRRTRRHQGPWERVGGVEGRDGRAGEGGGVWQDGVGWGGVGWGGEGWGGEGAWEDDGAGTRRMRSDSD